MWPRMHFLYLQGLYVFWTTGITTVKTIVIYATTNDSITYSKYAVVHLHICDNVYMILQ